MIRRAERPAEAAVRISPVPSQCGQGLVEASSTPVLSRWRLISIRPKLEIRPTWMRARSFLSASFIAFSTLRTWPDCSMSMKSITISPALSPHPNFPPAPPPSSALGLLAGSPGGCLDVGAVGGLLDIVLARRPARVDVDRDQSLGRIDDQISARFEL